jgi:hypothetical protein
MRKRLRTLLLLTFALTLLSSAIMIAPAQAATTGSVVYSNPAEPEPYYTRAVKLSNGDILATFTRKFPGNTNWVGMQPEHRQRFNLVPPQRDRSEQLWVE